MIALLDPARLATFYQLFVNALSFTVAINIVDSTASVSDLLITGGTVFIGLLFSMICSSLLTEFNLNLAARTAQTHSDMETLLSGPFQAAAFVLNAFITVETHFLSTTLGRWLFLTLDTANMSLEQVSTVVVTLLILTWLIALSAGFIAPVKALDLPAVQPPTVPQGRKSRQRRARVRPVLTKATNRARTVKGVALAPEGDSVAAATQLADSGSERAPLG